MRRRADAPVGARGGLALRPVPPRPGGATPSNAAGASVPGSVPASWLGDRLVQLRGNLKKNRWSLAYLGFLLYLAGATTQRFAVGDVAVATALVGLLFEKKHRVPPTILWLLVLLAWSCVGLATSPYRWAIADPLQVSLKLTIILFAAVNSVRTRSQIRFFMIFWLACYAIYPVRGAYLNYFVIHNTWFGRAIWNQTYSNPNDLAAITLLLFSVAAALVVSEPKGWFRRAALIGLPILALLIFLTQSRAGIIGFAALGVFALPAVSKAGARLRSFAMLGLLAGVVLMFAPSSVWQRMGALRNATDTSNLRAVDREGSAEQRWEIWKTAARIIHDHPVFGVGLGAYPAANQEYAPVAAGSEIQLGARDTHSTYLNVLAELGVPGLVIFIALIAATVRRAESVRRRCKRRFPRAAQQLYMVELGLLGFLVAGIWGSYARIAMLYVHLALIFVLAERLNREDQELRRAVQATAPAPV